jgi:magnesium transporter
MSASKADPGGTLMIKIRTFQTNRFIAIEKPVKNCWIDVRKANSDDLTILEKEHGVDNEVLQDIMDLDEQSRIEKWDNYSVIFVRIPILDITKEVPLFTIPLGIILFSDKIITVCTENTPILDQVSHNKPRNILNGNINQIVLAIIGRAAVQYLKDLKTINKKSAAIEHELQKSVKNNELIELLNIQKSLVFFSTSLKSNTMLLNKISRIFKNEDEADLFEDVQTDTVQALEMSNIYSNILTGTMDAFASVISNNLNIVMKKLAVVSIVLMIPTLIYSFFGMNVHLPLMGLKYIWIGIVGFSLLLSGVGAIILNLKKKR